MLTNWIFHAIYTVWRSNAYDLWDMRSFELGEFHSYISIAIKLKFAGRDFMSFALFAYNWRNGILILFVLVHKQNHYMAYAAKRHRQFTTSSAIKHSNNVRTEKKKIEQNVIRITIDSFRYFHTYEFFFNSISKGRINWCKEKWTNEKKTKNFCLISLFFSKGMK